MKKITLIFLLVVSIILPIYAEELTISDIKIQGLKRVDPGLVFDNIPFVLVFRKIILVINAPLSKKRSNIMYPKIGR